MDITRIFDLLDRYEQLYKKDDALCFKQEGNWIKFSTDQYIRNSYSLAYGLYISGLRKGDKVITISSNRPEWNFADMGMSMLGVIHVPVFTSLSCAEYDYIIEDSGARMIMISDLRLYRLISPHLISKGLTDKIISFDRIEGVRNIMDIIEMGAEASDDVREAVLKTKGTVKPDDFATLIYTSGTTGKPKGVMLSHKNLVSNFLSASSVFNLKPSDRYLSILPLCHVGGRMGNYQTQYSGSSIYYAESMTSIAANMKEIEPHGFDAVPRVLEKFYEVILSKGRALNGFKKSVFFWAVDLGLRFKPFGGNGLLYSMKLKIADKMVFSKWRAALGGNVNIVGCGGASLQPRIERVFWAAGIKVFNMYGLTETSPIITINRSEKGKLKLGSVGLPIENVEIKTADDGEILCKGPNVMLGYYNDPDLTKEAIDTEGWFHTGDIGLIDEEGFLMITDRKKEIFKLSNGKFIAPQVIENIFKESPIIDQIMVVGEHQKFASAIISPNFKFFDDWKKENDVSVNDSEELIRHPAVVSLFSTEVNKLNKRLNTYEGISRFRLVKDSWSPETGELSPTLKLRRQFVTEKYRSCVDQIYMK